MLPRSLSGMRAEHVKLLLQDGEVIELLAESCALLAQARVPTEVCKALPWPASSPYANQYRDG